MSQSHDTANSAGLPDASDVRFGMRGLLLTMAAVSVGAALVGHHLRGLGDDVRGHAATVWAACGFLVLALVARHAHRRLRLERLAGRRLLALAPCGPFELRWHSWLEVGGGLLLIGVGVLHLEGAANEFGNGRSIGTAYALCVVPCLISCALISGGIALAWWNRSIQLREQGVLRGLRLLPWTHVTECNRRRNVLVLRGVDYRQRDTELTALVRADELGGVDSILAQKLGAAYSPLAEAALQDERGVTIRTLIPVHPGDALPMRHWRTGVAALFPVRPRSVRHLRVALFAYAIVIATVELRPWERQTAEFNVGTAIGCAAVVLISLRDMWRSGPAGTPLVRLQPRLDWLSWCIWSLIATGCYGLNQQLWLATPLVDGTLGAVFGVMLSALMAMLFRVQFDLYENGIVHFPTRLIPWTSLRIAKWNPNGTGPLVLRYGVGRIRAKVPTNLRAAVDQVLQEKLETPQGQALIDAGETRGRGL